MKKKSTAASLVVRAMLKLNLESGERQNVLLFLQSCYGGRVRTYDFEAALLSLDKLTPEEHHALAASVMQLS
jgi:hypothetical protein